MQGLSSNKWTRHWPCYTDNIHDGNNMTATHINAIQPPVNNLTLYITTPTLPKYKKSHFCDFNQRSILGFSLSHQLGRYICHMTYDWTTVNKDPCFDSIIFQPTWIQWLQRYSRFSAYVAMWSTEARVSLLITEALHTLGRMQCLNTELTTWRHFQRAANIKVPESAWHFRPPVLWKTIQQGISGIKKTSWIQ